MKSFWPLLVLLLVVRPAAASADPVLDKGDLLARFGAYVDADAIYRQAAASNHDPSRSAALLMRRLAVAEEMQDYSRASALAAEIQGAHPDPEILMRMELSQAVLAIGRSHYKEAEKHLTAAHGHASRVSGPAARLYAYIDLTVRAVTAELQQGPPEPEAFRDQAHQAWAALQELPAVEQYPVLDLMRAIKFGEYWVRRPLELAAVADHEHDVARRDRWLRTAEDIDAMQATTLGARINASHDPEAGYTFNHVKLDLADFTYPVLQEIAGYLTGGDQILDALSANLGLHPAYIEQYRLKARYYNASGRTALFRLSQGHQHGDGEQAVRDFQTASGFWTQAHQPVQAVDTGCLLQMTRFLMREPGWEAAVLSDTQSLLAESQKLGYLGGGFQAFYYQGVALASRGELPAAEKALRQSLHELDAIETELGASQAARSVTASLTYGLFDALVDVLTRQGKNSEALDATEHFRSSAVTSCVDVSKVASRDPEVKKALLKVAATQERTQDLEDQVRSQEALPEPQQDKALLSRLSGEIARNRQEFYEAINQIRKRDPDYERLVSIRPTEFAKIQPHLPEDTVLLQYYAAADKLYIFVATRKELHIQAVDVTRSALEDNVRLVRREMARAGREQSAMLQGASQEALMNLHRYLIDPVEKDLQGHSIVAISPSGMLYYLPFAALARQQGGGVEYLVQRKAVVVLTQLEVLEVLGTARPVSESLLALGNPDGSLPGAQAEVTDLAGLFPQHKIFLNQDATKARITHLDPGTSIVHLATHGVLNAQDVNGSYLILAGSGTQSRLTTGEIYGLDFKKVTLVTLSACETALGERQPGAEIATLAQAFSVAGSHSILASLWDVSDQATHELMVSFYGGLRGKKSMAEALRQAQIKLLQQPATAHPYYWSSFELIGDWR